MPTLLTRRVDEAVAALRSGGLVGLPTETVYGLGADATNVDAVRHIYAVKGRPPGHPVIVHCPNVDDVRRWGSIPGWAEPLAEQAWPGPLTLVLPLHQPAPHLTGGQPTIAVRIPGHPLTREVLQSFAGGVAAPSANRFGRVSPTTAQDVVDDLGELLDVERDRVLDGGACQVGIESTIVDATTDQPRILRPGAVTEQQISDWTGLGVRSADGTIRVPGSLAAHYSPRATVLLAERAGLSGLLRSLASADQPRVVGLIAPSDVPTTTKGHVLELAAPRDSLEYAHDLYSALRRADDQGVEIVVAVLPHHDGIGHAVRDRLTRAANKPEPA